jgi:hypothetical protein
MLNGRVLVAHACHPGYSQELGGSQRQRSGESQFEAKPGQIVQEVLSWKNPSVKRAGGVAQGVDPKFKPQYHTHKHTQNLPKTVTKCSVQTGMWGAFGKPQGTVARIHIGPGNYVHPHQAAE